MSLWSGFWQKICEPLDGFLWHRDITHPIIRPVLRNEIFAAGSALIVGATLYAAFPTILWFGAGLACISWIFWSWARFFLGSPWTGATVVRGILFGFGLRLIIIAILLYLALAWFNASPVALMAGMIGGAFLALASYAYIYWRSGKI